MKPKVINTEPEYTEVSRRKGYKSICYGVQKSSRP